MEQEIKFNTFGKILEGDNAGWSVKIIDDREKTGGFFIYQFQTNNPSIGYDDWLETLENVRGYIKEANWIIEWDN